MEVEKYSEFYKVLSEECRIGLLFYLEREGKSSVTDITEAVDAGQSCVSHHLKKLEEAGLVEREVDGNRRLYSVNEELFEPVVEPLRQRFGD